MLHALCRVSPAYRGSTCPWRSWKLPLRRDSGTVSDTRHQPDHTQTHPYDDPATMRSRGPRPQRARARAAVTLVTLVIGQQTPQGLGRHAVIKVDCVPVDHLAYARVGGGDGHEGGGCTNGASSVVPCSICCSPVTVGMSSTGVDCFLVVVSARASATGCESGSRVPAQQFR
jgi:hypothetical protein